MHRHAKLKFNYFIVLSDLSGINLISSPYVSSYSAAGASCAFYEL